MSDDLGDLADASLPPDVSALAVPIPLSSFMPWHRPRKQFIRERQWGKFAHQLLTRLGVGDATGPRNIRYLTLPGIDYLDVRILAGVCTKRGCTLTSTGFLSMSEGNPVRARAAFREEQLKQAGHVTDDSITLPNRLEEIASGTSQAHRELRRRASFDIVNIDACGSIAKPDSQHPWRLLDALYKLVEMQIDTRRTPWMLYLTTDARQDSLSGALRQAFTDAIVTNAAHPDFDLGARELFTIPSIEAFSQGLEANTSDPGRFLSFYTLGLSKWLLHLCSAAGWEVRALDHFCYSTMPPDDPQPTMACLAFEFMPRPLALIDGSGAVNVEPQAYIPAENYSMRALNSARSMANLDHLMQSNNDLRARMIAKTKLLLEEAGYLPETLAGYDAFAAN